MILVLFVISLISQPFYNMYMYAYMCIYTHVVLLRINDNNNIYFITEILCQRMYFLILT